MAHSTVFKEEGQIEGRMYTQKVEGKELFRSIVTFKDLLIEDANMFYHTPGRLEKYFTETSNVQEFEIAEFDAKGLPSLIYVSYSLPMLLTDRDMVLRPKHKKIDDKTFL